MRLDALIFGGGAAGLWLLDRLSRDGHHVLLLESRLLGADNTVASHGILRAPSPYASSKSVESRRAITRLWQDSLLGRATPNLTKTRLRSGHSYIWQVEPVRSRGGHTGNQLHSIGGIELVSSNERPDALRKVIGPIVRVPELIIDPRSLIEDLASQYADRILLIDEKNGLEFQLESPGEVSSVRLISPTDRTLLELRPRQVILTAGSGNGKLRQLAGLSSDIPQSRLRQLVLARGNLPELNGHCFADKESQLTVTTEFDSTGQTIWQVSGRFGECGIECDPKSLVADVYGQLSSHLPGLDLTSVEWSTYTVDRAEAATDNGSAPNSIQVLCAGNVTTGMSAKLILAPVLANEIAHRATSPYFSAGFDTTRLVNWPRPAIAEYPWMHPDLHWWKHHDDPAVGHRRAA